jgi:signal transduction histidine kinase/CheY-like chemotaxis protein
VISFPHYRGVLTELAQLDKSNLEIALRRILELDAKALTLERVSYWELEPDHSAIRCHALYCRSPGTFSAGGELRATDFPKYFEAMLGCRAIVAHDAWTHPQTAEFADVYFRPNGITSMLDVPVWRRGKLAGVVCHEQVGAPRVWTIEEQDFALAIGNMVSIALEATDRRRAEEGFAMFARATNDVLWDWDIATGRVDFNEALTSVFRIEMDGRRTTVAWWVANIHPNDRARVEASIHAALESTVTSWSEQYQWVRGDGTIATVMDRGFIARDERGGAVRMVGSMLDISERVDMQARLALSDRMASVGTLATGVAHEINNPLTYIMTNLACALEMVDEGSAGRDSIVELLREAAEGAERVRRVVRDLQTFARPQQDDVESLDPRTVIDSSINMAWNEIRHRAQLVKDYGPLPNVRVNRARLGQVILNLLINAAQAIPEGDVERHQVRIHTRTDPQGRVVIEVSDTGCGLSPEARTRMFEPFFTTKPVGVGTGLGLSICHSIVTSQGGSIEAESPPGGGCLMRITLPPAPEVQQQDLEPAKQTARRRILLVDDEVMVRKALSRLLGPRHDLVVAENGETALACIRRGPPMDVILCDLMMPKMTGMELYQRLLAELPEQAARMVFMTGGAFSQRASEFVASHARPMLHKPIALPAVTEAIAAVGER